MKKVLYLEGGGDSKELHTRCREGFRKLLEKSGFTGRMPQLVACGGRGATLGDFKTELSNASPGDYIAMLIDSEDPIAVTSAWDHLKQRDNWDQPANTTDEQVLFMATCMESWIVADRATLKAHYGQHLQESALPALTILEQRNRHAIQDALTHATRDCSNAYAKGKRSFEVLAKLVPATLKPHLPNFVRAVEILDQKL